MPQLFLGNWTISKWFNDFRAPCEVCYSDSKSNLSQRHTCRCQSVFCTYKTMICFSVLYMYRFIHITVSLFYTCNSFARSDGESMRQEGRERSDEEESRNRAESSREGRRRRARPERINKTEGNAVPNFQIEKDMRGAIRQQIEEITVKDGPFWLNVGEGHPAEA